MVRSWRSCSNTNRSFSSITPLVFHGMRSFYTQSPKFVQCQGCSRSALSGMCPVRTSRGGYPHPPAFCKKSPQVAKNKEREREKERQENQRGGKPLRIDVLPQM